VSVSIKYFTFIALTPESCGQKKRCGPFLRRPKEPLEEIAFFEAGGGTSSASYRQSAPISTPIRKTLLACSIGTAIAAG
jgi:hypothetical protein